MSHRLSVVRYRYSAAQILSEILRDDLHSSDDSDEDDLFDDASDSDVDCSVGADSHNVAVDDVTGRDDVTVESVDVDSEDGDATVDYEPPEDLDHDTSPCDNNTDDGVMSDNGGGIDVDDGTGVMWSRCGSVSWTTHTPTMTRYPVHNIIAEERGLRQDLTIDSIAAAFRVFINDEMVKHILLWTNRHATEIKASSASFRWQELLPDEFLAFIGLSLLAGVQKSRNQRLLELWDEQWGYPVFPATMSFQRFTNILRALRFDNKATRTERIATTGNQAAAVQEMFDIFLISCRSSYNCGPSVTIDEQLISFHGRCRFRMFIPTKPGKYGLKLWIMADSETFYCADAQLYAGKVGNQTDVGQAARVVLQLTESISGTGRNVTTDNFFTSYQLAKELMKRRLSLVGTVRNNRKELPREMLPDRQREIYSSKFGFTDDGVTLVSYVPKRGKAVVLLSTQHRTSAVMSDDKKKPEIIAYYNGTKSGVDVLDKLVRTYTCKRASFRWTVAFFLNMLDIAAYNALVLWITANPSWQRGKPHRRRLFLRELGTQLLRNHASGRCSTTPHGKRQRIQECGRRSGITKAGDESSSPGSMRYCDIVKRRRRCLVCPRKKERKTTRECDTCGTPLCKEHSCVQIACPTCAEGGNGR